MKAPLAGVFTLGARTWQIKEEPLSTPTRLRKHALPETAPGLMCLGRKGPCQDLCDLRSLGVCLRGWGWPGFRG